MNAEPELLALMATAALGLAQLVLRGQLGTQVRRNFAETFPAFALLVACVLMADAGGTFSARGAVLFAAGRLGYLVLSVRPLRPVRRFAWALAVAGLIGLAAQMVVHVWGGVG